MIQRRVPQSFQSIHSRLSRVRFVRRNRLRGILMFSTASLRALVSSSWLYAATSARASLRVRRGIEAKVLYSTALAVITWLLAITLRGGQQCVRCHGWFHKDAARSIGDSSHFLLSAIALETRLDRFVTRSFFWLHIIKNSTLQHYQGLWNGSFWHFNCANFVPHFLSALQYSIVSAKA